ncbi:MAG TPA: carboxypeptidase regulatory-like domain-containing protein [Longimicrobium sp.]|nr:carboxypeptidase regulatory-like domain-containing protein [Longimicrobium sp.]
MKPRWSALLVAAAALLLARPLSAQIFGGRVIDQATSQPLKGATVELINDQNRVVQRARSDGDGFVAFELRQPGTYRVRTSMAGYTTRNSQALQIDIRQTVQVDIPLSTGLANGEVALDSLTVIGRSQPARRTDLEREGFYDREKMGFGRFMTAADIERRMAVQTTEIFRAIPGVTLIPTGSSRYRLAVTRSGTNCSPSIILDNMPVNATDELDDMVKPQDISGVEVYRGASEVPAQFMASRNSCGLVVIWTKRGEPNR